jgi:hypothetical protein
MRQLSPKSTGDVRIQTAVLREEKPQRAVVQTMNQEPAVAKFTGAPPWETIVVTPYYLFEPKQESLRILHACTANHSTTASAGARN